MQASTVPYRVETFATMQRMHRVSMPADAAAARAISLLTRPYHILSHVPPEEHRRSGLKQFGDA